MVREISRDTARAIVETETGPENRFADWYTFLVRDAGKWKIDNMRVYVPFGRQWFPYFMRRLGERPANVSFVIRGIVGEQR